MSLQHPVEWTDEKVARFWDFLAGRLHDSYFAKSVGGHVVDLLARHRRLDGARLVDYGCGQGFLFEHLRRRAPGARYVGLDFSPGSVAHVEGKFAGQPGFERAVHAAGLPSPIESGSADIAVSLEMIEHLDDERLDASLAEMRRLLRPGGLLCLTTPNAEDLDEQMVMCPDCGCVFHRWQHVRSWSPAALKARVAAHGFADIRTIETDLAPWYGRLKRALVRRIRPGRPVNLVCLAVRPPS